MDKIKFLDVFINELEKIDESLIKIITLDEMDENNFINDKDINNPKDATLPFESSLDEWEFELKDYIYYLDSLRNKLINKIYKIKNIK